MFGFGRRIRKVVRTLSMEGIKSAKTTSMQGDGDSSVLISSEAAQVISPYGGIDIAETERKLKSLIEYTIRSRWLAVDAIDCLRLPHQSIRCIVCDYEATRDVFEICTSECIFLGGKLERYVCPQCGGIFGPYKMLELSPEALSNEIATHYKIFSEGDSTHLEKLAFYSLEPEREGLFLNFGCGNDWSRSVQELRSDGYNVIGFEPFATKGSAHVLTDWDSLGEHRFDGIFANNVLEHLRFPERELLRMKTLLKPTGKIALSTPCYSYAFEFTRFHLFFYTNQSFAHLAKKCGFAIIKAEMDHAINYDNRVIQAV